MNDFIGRYYLDDLDICDEAIELFKNSQSLQEQGFASRDGVNRVDLRVKESTDLCRSFDFFQSQPSTQKLLDFLWASVQDYAYQYESLWESCFALLNNMKLQYYKPPSGAYKQFHCERNTPKTSVCLVWMFYLNTVEEGGGTEFKYFDHIEKAEKGKLLIWPSDFTHTHRGIPSPTEEKYIFTGWYGFT